MLFVIVFVYSYFWLNNCLYYEDSITCLNLWSLHGLYRQIWLTNDLICTESLFWLFNKPLIQQLACNLHSTEFNLNLIYFFTLQLNSQQNSLNGNLNAKHKPLLLFIYSIESRQTFHQMALRWIQYLHPHFP